MINIEQLMLYRNFEEKNIDESNSLNILVHIFETINIALYNKEMYYAMNELDKRCMIDSLYNCVNVLIEKADTFGLEGNLLNSYVALLIADNENAFSKSCERAGEIDGSINKIAIHDLSILKKIFEVELKDIDNILEIKCFSFLLEYKHKDATSKIFNKRIRDRICKLAVDLERAGNNIEFYATVVDFYKENGVGKLGLNKAFRIKETEKSGSMVPEIVPVTSIEHVYLDDLVGYELQKKRLVDNTEDFIHGRKANNVLLFGDSGTGKSSSIKAILNQYYDSGLRMIEVYKHQFKCLSTIIEEVKDRNYKFIIYMDDLSFEDYEVEYKYLKAVIEGGLGKKPDNVLIYATSNRRHLVREKWSDKEDRREDLHASDTVEEKLSLVNRFGVSIFYCAPNKKEFENIVSELAKRYNVSMPNEVLFAEANKWVMRHGSLSGRSATQFINYILGQEER